jgi:hypothetical protein
MSQESLVGLIPLALIIVYVIVRAVFMRGDGGGHAGMAVCRKCGRTFPRPFLAPNLVTGKLVRCAHCGAWAVLPAALPAELELARLREATTGTPTQPQTSEQDALRRRIEDSKYE